MTSRSGQGRATKGSVMAYGYVVGFITIEDAAGYEEYAERDPAIVFEHGGEYLARGGRSEVLEGRIPGTRTVIIRFPSLEAARDWYRSAAYSEIKPIRQAVASASIMCVEGV